MRRLRMLVLAVLLALGAAACGSGLTEEPVQLDASPLVPDATDPATAAPDGQATAPANGEAEQADSGGDDAAGDPGQQGSGQQGSSGAAQGDGASDPGSQLTALVDAGPVGANGAAYLRGDRPRVVLEVDIQEGAQMPSGVLDHVRSILDRESASTVELRTGSADIARRDTWTADQLREAAGQLRDTAHTDDTAVVHLLVLRDGYEQDGVLGVAFGATAAVVFPDQWADLATALLSGDRIARAVTTHEVGHLLGLVGLYEEPTSNHEDPDHPGHTRDSDDVMYYAVERSIIAQLDGIPTDFGPATRADLAAIRQG